MWVFFENGTFYSAVNDFDDNKIRWVRSRDERSARILADWVNARRSSRKKKSKVKLIFMESSDYAYRVKVTADEWLAYVTEQTEQSKATNFKSEVAKNVGYTSGFLTALHRVWSVMYDYQEKEFQFDDLG